MPGIVQGVVVNTVLYRRDGVTVGTDDDEMFGAYMYSRAQSVMGGTSQIQKNIIAGRILGLSG